MYLVFGKMCAFVELTERNYGTSEEINEVAEIVGDAIVRTMTSIASKERYEHWLLTTIRSGQEELQYRPNREHVRYMIKSAKAAAEGKSVAQLMMEEDEDEEFQEETEPVKADNSRLKSV